MNNVDTHEAVKNFISSGMPEKQAEAITLYVRNMVRHETNNEYKDLATKLNVVEVKNELQLEITKIKNELKLEINEVKNELKLETSEIKRDMKWVMFFLTALMTMSITTIGLLLKIALFH